MHRPPDTWINLESRTTRAHWHFLNCVLAVARPVLLRGGLVFCNQDSRPFTIWQLHERLWGACRRADLRRIRWHDLRQTFASQLMMAGVPVRRVQEWMGHSTIIMTMRYAHLAPGGDQEMFEVLDSENRGKNVAKGNG